jgi:FkbM family methyltransferase
MKFNGIGNGSIVFDFGGFEGNWAAEIRSIYDATVHIFEPHPTFAQKIRERFEQDPSVIVYDFALGRSKGSLTLSDEGDASSSLRDATRTVTGHIQSVHDFFKLTPIKKIDLMKINIEGGEYDLLPALADAGLMGKIEILQIQFHLFSKLDIERREEIREVLLRTHECNWSYDFVWEQWTRRINLR